MTTYCQPDRIISIYHVWMSHTFIWTVPKRCGRGQSKFSKYITLNIIFLNFGDVLWLRILSAVFGAVRVGCGACLLWLTPHTIRVKQSYGVSGQRARCLFNWVKTEC